MLPRRFRRCPPRREPCLRHVPDRRVGEGVQARGPRKTSSSISVSTNSKLTRPTSSHPSRCGRDGSQRLRSACRRHRGPERVPSRQQLAWPAPGARGRRPHVERRIDQEASDVNSRPLSRDGCDQLHDRSRSLRVESDMTDDGAVADSCCPADRPSRRTASHYPGLRGRDTGTPDRAAANRHLGEALGWYRIAARPADSRSATG
jgi:hypothetical protein